MTSIALKGFSTATTITSIVVDFVTGFVTNVGKAMAMARGVEMNGQIAHELKHEYPDMSIAAITAMLNDNLRKEIYGD